MPIQLGTVAAIGFEDFPPPQWLACFRALGCTTVQAYRNQAAQVTVQQMRETIAASGLPCDSLHGVFGEQFDPSSPDERARRFAADAYRVEGELALALGGPLVVVHCSTIRREGVSPQERALRVAQLRKSIHDLGLFGQNTGVTYAFENLPGYHPVGWDVRELAGILDEVGAPNTGMCFDTGHANMVGDAAAAVRHAAAQMIYLHVSDNGSREDEHLMPTHGTIDFDALARAVHQVGYGGTMMLEVFYKIDQLQRLIDDGFAGRLAHIVALANGAEKQ